MISLFKLSVFCGFFFWPCNPDCGILAPWPGIEPMPLKWKCGGLTSGLQGKSQISFSWFCLGRLYISRNLSISSSLSTLLACNCLWDSVLSFCITVHGGCLENPRDGEPGRLPSVGSHRVGHDWSDLAAAAAWWLFLLSFFICLFGSSHFSSWWVWL